MDLEDTLKRASDYWGKHKDEYYEVEHVTGSILKTYKRKDGRKGKYGTLYQFDTDLLEEKCDKFVKEFKEGKMQFEDSILNMGLVLTHLVQRDDDFSPYADRILKQMMRGDNNA